MNGKIVEFGGDAEFYRRRADNLRKDRPADAMKFLYRALERQPEDEKALLIAAEIALENDWPRLAARLSGRAAQSIPACYLLGASLAKMRFVRPALTALAYCAHESASENLRDSALREIYDLRARESAGDRWEARIARRRENIRARMLEGQYDAAARLAQDGEARFPESGMESLRARALWQKGDISRAAHVKTNECLPLVRGRKKENFRPETYAQAVRGWMIQGKYEKVLSGNKLPGPEGAYLKAAAAARKGAERNQYLPALLDIQAMDPTDPVADWAIRLIAEGKDRQIPRLYMVTGAAARSMTERLRLAEADETAVCWGLRQTGLCGCAAMAAMNLARGETLLRDALADPYTPGGCRQAVAGALAHIGARPPFLGVTPARLWMGSPWETAEARIPNIGFKILEIAMSISEPEMAEALFAAWAAFVDSGRLRRSGKDLSGWAAAIALAAREISGRSCHVNVNINRKNLARSRSIAKKAKKEQNK